jgi:Tfp pilus assembly protein PilF
VLRIFLLTALTALGQTAADQAYDALKAKDYDRAVALFAKAAAAEPGRASIHTDWAYTLLKTGDREAARDQFADAMRLDPADEHVALEYAFLCYETKQQQTARRTFDRIRKNGNATAQAAFENIDRPLCEGIERWSRAVTLEPDNFSAHEELARLAEQRDELGLAAEHYAIARRLRPDRTDLLLDLGRVWKALDRSEDAMAAEIAASRGGEPMTAEQARELLPSRYPYVYEFQNALKLDPANADLRRELAYLRLQMGDRAEAETEFARVVEQSPEDLLSVAQLGFLELSRGDTERAMPLLNKILAAGDDDLADRVREALHLPRTLRRREEQPKSDVSTQAKELASKSLEKGYLADAVKYLQVAHENEPLDFEVMLKLGWTYNVLKDDATAVQWFNLARQSPDPKTAAEASQAYHNLEPEFQKIRTTVWAFPTFSTRWHDVFAYAQAKTELRLPGWWVHPYLSARFVGDTTGQVNLASLGPQFLSERSVILGIGLATPVWKGATGWLEAGESLRYSPTPQDPGKIVPDYRGGVSFSKGVGNLLAPGKHGMFAETNDDGIYVSRFDRDTLLYSQNRAGWTLRPLEWVHAQLYWNVDVTADAKGQYWANYAETGPGLRFRFDAIPSVLFSVNALRGSYFVNEGNPRGPNFNDLRVGIWYAFTR